jgi:hypothetical protein
MNVGITPTYAFEIADEEVAGLGRDEQRRLVEDTQCLIVRSVRLDGRRAQAPIQRGSASLHIRELARDGINEANQTRVFHRYGGSCFDDTSEPLLVEIDISFRRKRKHVHMHHVIGTLDEEPVALLLDMHCHGKQRPADRLAVAPANDVWIAVKHLSLVGVQNGRRAHLLDRIKQGAGSGHVE